MGTRATAKCVMIIAGEASGDQHGAKLVHAMRQAYPACVFCGIGGRALKQAGVRIFIEAATLSVVGITEAVAKMPVLFRAMQTVKRLLRQIRPDLLILIDFPDFNLHVAGRAKALGIPVLYYISPQIWAWRSGRVRKIGRRIDHMAVILPFEERFYRDHGIPVTFVGHPLIDQLPPAAENPAGQPVPSAPVLGLLPGSRDREVARHLPIMLAAARTLKERFAETTVIVSAAPSVQRDIVSEMIRGFPGLDVQVADGHVSEVFTQSRLVIAASGTVTLEAAIYGTPTVIIYKVSPLSYRLAKALVQVRYVGLANLIAGRQIVPELLQDDATAGTIAHTVGGMIGDSRQLEAIRQQMLAVRRRLGDPGASGRVADIALKMMGAR